MQEMRETIKETRDGLPSLKKQVAILEEKMIFPLVCRSCGKPLRGDFILYPYRGAKIDVKHEAVICEPNFFH